LLILWTYVRWGGAATADLHGALTALTGLAAAADDAERVTQLDLLERLNGVGGPAMRPA
jgi:hypothetical protein